MQRQCARGGDVHSPSMPLGALPVEAAIPQLRSALASRRAAVLIAAPGAGKTTRVPPALIDAGRVLVLQPRRVAARAVARRIADEQGWTLGREVGWHVRFERRFTADTRLLIVTEGMLTAYLDADPLLSDVATLVLDEFHERSIHTDLGLALARQAWRARDDLRVLVMSATLDPAPVSAFLDRLPGIRCAGHAAPLDDRVRAGPERGASPWRCALRASSGQVLCFLPGARRDRARGAGSRRRGGSPRRGDRHLARLARRRGAGPRAAALGDARGSCWPPTSPRRRSPFRASTAVIDTGLQKVARYDAERAIDALVLERVTLRQRRSARRPRRPARPRRGAAPLGRARSPAARARAGDPARGPGRDAPGRAGCRQPAAYVRVVRARRDRDRVDAALTLLGGWGPSTA